MRTLVLGLGNPILTDDGVGIHVVRTVADRWSGDADADFLEASVGGLRLLEVITGYDRLILVDAIQTPDGTPGQVHQSSPDDLHSPLHTGSTHDFSFQGALAWGRRMGMALPTNEQIAFVVVEVADVLTFGEECTPAVAAGIPGAAEAVVRLLNDFPGVRQPDVPGLERPAQSGGVQL